MHPRTALPTCLMLALAISGCAPRDTAGNRVTGGTRVASEAATAAAPERDVQHTAQTIADELVRFRGQVRSGQVKLPATR